MKYDTIYYNNSATSQEGKTVNESVRIVFGGAPNKSARFTLVEAIRKLVRGTNSFDAKIIKDSDYTRLFNTWVNNINVYQKSKSTTIEPSSDNGRGRIRDSITYKFLFLDGMLKIYYVMESYEIRKLMPRYGSIIKGLLAVPMAQMDETQQGEVTQDSDRANNTIVTRDASQTVEVEQGITHLTLEKICSTEPVHTFSSISNRWMALPSIKVSTINTFNTILQVYNLPSFLYSEKSAPNMMPFENFLFGKYQIEFKFVVNANKFHVGKVVASVKYDSYQLDAQYNDLTTILSRPHVIMDLAANNEAILAVPFKYHRTFVRNASLANSQYGSKAAQYATIQLSILSPLGAVAGAPNEMYIRPFYTIKQGVFTGMSYKVPLAQMDTVAKGARVLENALHFIGDIPNMDKPFDSARVSQVVPRPRLNFQSGKGVSDCIPLRLDPSTQTTYTKDHEYPDDPTNVLQIARIWGFAGSFDWKNSSAEGSELWSMAIEPTWRQRSNWDGVPTPLEYVSSMYQFWSGPMEVRLDFVSNAFHTGSVMLSAEFGRVSSNVEQSGSTYTKVFHLGEQKTVSFTIPYIYDTVWRRTSSIPFCPLQQGLVADATKGKLGVMRANSSAFKVRVINKLVPVTSVVQDIKVLVFIRASDKFTLHSPIMANMISSHAGYFLSDFPGTFPVKVSNSLTAQSLPLNMRETGAIQLSHKWISGKLPKEVKSSLVANQNIEATPIQLDSQDQINPLKVTKQNAHFYKGLPKPIENKNYYWIVQEAPDREVAAMYVPKVKPPPKTKQLMGPAIHTNNQSNFKEWVWDLNDISVKYSYDSENHRIQTRFIPPGSTHVETWFIDVSDYNIATMAQMDDGEKEEMDPTDDFSSGCDRQAIQSVESHLDIKDLLRRPFCVISNILVKAMQETEKIGYFFIPCMPPSHMWAFGADVNKVFAPMLGRSVSTHLLDMFRFWRGSQRYMIITSRTTGPPIYASYVPHSGAMLTGRVTFDIKDLLRANAPPSSFGLATEIMIPSINPSMAIEAPYDTEDNWSLMMCEDWARNFSWRDKGDYNCGHIVLWSTEDFTMDVFWSAGDDFKVANFLGPPSCVAPFAKYMYSDNHPTAQMEDFRREERGNRVSQFLKKTTFPLGVALTSQVPVIGNTMATFIAGWKANQAVDDIQSLTAQSSNLISQAESTLTQVDGILEFLKVQLAQTFDVSSSIFTASVNALFDFFTNLGSWDPIKIAWSILRFFCNLASAPITKLCSFIPMLTQLFRIHPHAQDIGSIEQISGSFWTEDKIKEGFKVFVALIGTLAGVVVNTASWQPKKLLMAVLKSPLDYRNVAYANQVLRFVDNVFTIFKDAVTWVVNYVHPQSRILARLHEESDELRMFVTESQKLLNEANRGAFALPHFRLRYWVNVLKAYEIQRRLVGLPNGCVNQMVSRMCSDVIRQGKENMADLKCSPIKYEPFVVCIEGGAGIGKSVMVRDLATKLLHSVGITSFPGDPVYYRISGSKHWNGYADQPVVVYDDWMNILEPSIAAQVLNEIYQLKSCATFVPEQAAIEEKKIKATPRIVILLCNDGFPESALINLVGCKEAVYRRRDVMVVASVKPDYEDRDLRTLSEPEQVSFSHLHFSRYENPCDRESLTYDKIEYPSFIDYVTKRFQNYDRQELTNVKRRMTNLLSFFSTTEISLRDPFSVFYEGLNRVTNERPDHLPSDRLEEQIRMIALGLDAVRETEDETPYVEPVWGETEAQMSLTTLSTASMLFATAVPASIQAFKRFARFIGSGFERCGAIGRCNVCLDTVSLHYVCRESWSRVTSRSLEGLHVMCEPCFARIASSGYRCPCCRSTTPPLRIISREAYESSIFLAKLYKTSSFCHSVLIRAMDWFKQHYGFEIWGSIVAAIAIISSGIAKWRMMNGDGDLGIVIGNIANCGLMGLSVYIMSKAINTNVVHGVLNVDPTTYQWVPMFVSFDTESARLVVDIINFNNSRDKTDTRRLELMDRYRATFLRKMGSMDLYCEVITGVFITDNVVALNRRIEKHNRKVMRLERIGADAIEKKEDIERDRIRLLSEVTEAQIESPGPGPYPVRHFPSERTLDMSDIYHYSCDLGRLDFKKATNLVCDHAPLLTHIEYISYENGDYFVNSRQGLVKLGPACENFPECPLADRTGQEDFATRFFNHNRDAWFRWIMALEADASTQIKTHLPSFAFPSWISMEESAEELIITPESWLVCSSIPSILKSLLKGIAIIAGAIVLFKSASGLLNFILPSAQIIPSGDAVIRHFRPRMERITRSQVTAQSEMQEAICEKINANYFVIVVVEDGKDVRFLNGVGIKQRLGLIPKHYYRFLSSMAKKEGVEFFIAKPFNNEHRIKIAYSETDFTYSDTADICIYQLPQSYPMFKDITKYMARDEDINKKMANTGLIVEPPLRGNRMTRVIPIDIKEYVRRKFIMSEQGGYESEHCLSYSYSKKGACGSLILKDHSQKPIVAMHIAGQGDGTSGTGYGVLLTAEMFAEFQCEVSGQCVDQEDLTLEGCDELRIHLPADSVVDYMGRMPKRLVPYAPHKSKIKPSLIQTLLPWEPIKQPAILSSYDKRYTHSISPLIAGAAKHGYLTGNFSTEQLEKVGKLRYYQLMKIKPHVVQPAKLSIEDAITGYNGLEFYDALHLDTSAGWPYCTTNKTLKYDYCQVIRNENSEVERVELADEVRKAVMESTKARRNGKVWPTVFVDTLKDEKRKPEKLLKLGGTRVFCASPFDFSICMRQNFLHFVASYMKNRWDLKHAVGINLQGPDCTELVSRLLSVGPNIVTIDYSNFGPGFNAGVANQAALGIKKWTLENVAGVDPSELDCLMEENLNSVHCLNHLVYRQIGGSPSGSPITVIINSEVNILYIMIAWDCLVNVANKWSVFDKDVCLFVYGDDLIMAVSDEYIERFNAVTITNFFKTYGIVATDASKSSTVTPYTDIQRASFLKCTFHPHPKRMGQWLARLDEESLKDTPMWIKEEVSFKEATALNAEAAIRGAFGYGKEYFDNFQDTINKALVQCSIPPILLDWDELDAMFYGE